MSEIGFIILRHVRCETTNKYWMDCYDCIRTHYLDNKIIIIDDDSDYTFITKKSLYKTLVIKSEYPKRGELLPYYYYLQFKLFDTAVILHDSVFIQKPMDFHVDTYKFIWEFKHYWDQPQDEMNMIRQFNNPELVQFYNNKNLWKGCYGGMSIITHDYLTKINDTYPIHTLLNVVRNRYNRCSLERVIGCLLQTNGMIPSLLGDIHNYCPWGITVQEKDKYLYLPLVKVWSGR
jgi:hypothetical protein